MKKYSLFILSAWVVMACSKGSELDQKKAQLEELRKEQQDLSAQIKKLEGELAVLQPNRGENVRVKPVKVAAVSPATFKHFINVQGVIDSRYNILVAPKMAGIVTAVYVKEGDRVRKGQVLATVDDAVLQQNLAQLKTNLELATTVYERQKKLWDQKIGSEVQYLQTKNNKESLERQIATLQSQIAQARITSPINGTVNEVNIKIGEGANPAVGAVRVVDPSNIRVVAKVADSYIGAVKQGDAVNIQVPDLNRSIDGKISFVGQVVDPTNRTFDIEVSIPNPEGMLKPNMLVTVNINDQTKANTVVIEENIIQRTEFGDIVFVAGQDGGKKVAKMRKVKTGLSYNGKAEILEGLKPGDQLITAGFDDLSDNQPIQI